LEETSGKFEILNREKDSIISRLSSIGDDNSRGIIRVNENIERIRNNNDFIMEKIEKHEKKLIKMTDGFLIMSEFEKNLKLNLETIGDNKKSLNDLEYFSNKKFTEIDSKIFEIIDKVKDMKDSISINKSNNILSINANTNTNNHNNNNLYNNNNDNIVNHSNPNIINNELDSNLNNLYNNNMSNVVPNSYSDQISKLYKEIDNIKKLNREFNDKIDRLLKQNLSSETIIIDLKTKLEDYSIIRNIASALEKDNVLNIKNIDSLDYRILDLEKKSNKIESNFIAIFDFINKSSDINKNILNLNSSKLNREEFEKSVKNINMELEKLDIKLIDNLKLFESKVKNSLNQLGENQINFSGKNSSEENFLFSNGIIEENFKKNLIGLIIDEIEIKKSEILNIENDFFLNLIEKYNLNEIDLKEMKMNLMEISSKFSDFFQKNYLEFSEETKKSLNFLEKYMQNVKKDMHRRFENLENMDEDFQKEFNELSNQLHSINDENTKLMSVQDLIKLAFEQIKKNNIRLDQIILRQDDFSKDILGKVKQDLTKESLKLLDEIRNAVNTVEGKLSEKADMNIFDEFGKKVDIKMTNEFQKKLDKTDLRKNNCLINKKIDSLENKISKTLVDTLIDLQMDDQPLIIKKTNAGEKCASCNQYKIYNNMSNNTNNFNPMKTNSFFNKENLNKNNINICEDDDYFATKTQGKFKFRQIQDNSNKYGCGSYSRFLNNVENINEELSSIEKFNSKLPEISLNILGKNSNKKSLTLAINSPNNTNSYSNIIANTNCNVNNKNSSSKIKLDGCAEKEFNDMMNEEFEKKILNADVLLKKANKINENAEKRNLNKNKNQA
jgi:hypothetical protein